MYRAVQLFLNKSNETIPTNLMPQNNALIIVASSLPFD
jgi:hypothetical protein